MFLLIQNNQICFSSRAERSDERIDFTMMCEFFLCDQSSLFETVTMFLVSTSP